MKNILKILQVILFLSMIMCSSIRTDEYNLNNYQNISIENDMDVTLYKMYPYTNYIKKEIKAASVYICVDIDSNDTIVLLDFNLKVPTFIKNKGITTYIIRKSDTYQYSGKVYLSVSDGDSLLLRNGFLCGRLTYLED